MSEELEDLMVARVKGGGKHDFHQSDVAPVRQTVNAAKAFKVMRNIVNLIILSLAPFGK